MRIVITAFLFLVLSVTAFGGTIWGRAVDTNGRGIAKVRIVIWNANTQEQQAAVFTSPFGYYSAEVPGCGLTYLIYAESRRYRFIGSPAIVLFLEDEDGIIEASFAAF